MKAGIRIAGAAIVLGLVATAAFTAKVPMNLLLIYLVLGTFSFLNYWRDKRAAQKDGWRVPERSLHLLDLVFGIAGGLLAQVALRHKISKPAFGTVSGLIAALHIVGLSLLLTGTITYPLD